ncbi:MAG: ABC transporter substrate-binding protein [Chloroflexota bacterium]
MNKKQWFVKGLIFIMVAAVLSGCAVIDLFQPEAAAPVEVPEAEEPTSETQEAEELISTRLTMGYIPNIQFAPVYVALEKGYFREAGFDVTLEYGNEADAVALVGAGDQTFCIASGEQVLLARAQGLPVTYVAAWYQDFPVGVASFVDKGIVSPDDLEGTTVGIPGLFGASYIGFIALLDAEGLTEEDVDLLPIGFNQVEALVAGQSESVVIYLANEPVVLRSKGYEVNVIRVADYLELVSNGLVTNEETLKNDPGMVRSFISALLMGISDTIADPNEAYEISKKYVENLEDADSDLQHAILSESIRLWETDHIGFSDPSGWENMQEVLLEMGLINQPINLEEAFTNDLLP